MQGQIGNFIQTSVKTGVLASSRCASFNPIRSASRARKTPQLDPLKPLEKMASVPILEDTERIFQPTNDDIVQGEELFTFSRKNEIKFVLSAPRPEFAPIHNMPEGHTKMVNFFQVGKHLMLVDMPGYGYKQPRDFAESAEAYLATRKNLRNIVLLIDSNTGVKNVDLLAIEMLEQFSLPYMIVLTKIDRPSKHSLLRTVFDTKAVIRNQTSFCLPQPFLVSSQNLDGVAMLKAFIGITSGVIFQSQNTESTNSSR